MKYLESIQQGLEDLLIKDERVLLVGEDMLDPYGGAFKATKGLSTKFPTRLVPTPISESAIAGIGTGLAMRGFRPIVEIMFGDFLGLCLDQILNSATKFPLMYHGKVKVPLVIRTPMGGGRGYGPTHSQSIEKHFLGIPGLHVVAPSVFHSPGELLNKATLEDDDPVLFIENKILYTKELVQPGKQLHLETIYEKGYPTQLVKNYISNAEPDVILFTYGGTSDLVREIMIDMIEEEINILAVCPSLISDFEMTSLFSSNIKFKKVIIVEEGAIGYNWGSEVAAILYERQLNNLAKPINRLASRHDIIPAAKYLEQEYLINKKAILEDIFNII
jgi:pyruvate/2-oxoglutarate/acetoin dehydrogenase E1 component